MFLIIPYVKTKLITYHKKKKKTKKMYVICAEFVEFILVEIFKFLICLNF